MASIFAVLVSHESVFLWKGTPGIQGKADNILAVGYEIRYGSKEGTGRYFPTVLLTEEKADCPGEFREPQSAIPSIERRDCLSVVPETVLQRHGSLSPDVV